MLQSHQKLLPDELGGLGGALWVLASVSVEDFSGEPDKVFDTLARGLPAKPQFEVFWTVVRFNAVLVMNGFLGHMLAPERPLHDDPVLQNPLFLTLNSFADVSTCVDIWFTRRHEWNSDAAA